MERPRSPSTLLDTLKHGRSQWNSSICWISTTLPGAAQYQIENVKIWESERSQVWCSRPNWADVLVTPTFFEIVLGVRCAHQHALNIKKCNWDLQRCLRELADTENGRTSAVTETPTSNSWSPLCPTFAQLWAPDNQKSKDPWLAEQCFPQKPKCNQETQGSQGIQIKGDSISRIRRIQIWEGWVSWFTDSIHGLFWLVLAS